MPDSPKTVVITGASRGLGAGMAHWFLNEGYQLGLCSRQLPELGDSSLVHCASVDIQSPAAIHNFVHDVEGKFGGIDLWINNAGVLGPIGPLRDCSPDELRTHMETNVLGVLYGAQAFLQHLHRHARFGVLLNISSGAGRSGYAGWTAYCAAKAAVDRFTEALALEEDPSRLRTHSVAPGVIDTQMQTEIRQCSASRFPMVEKFKNLKKNEQFNSPAFVARHCRDLAFGDSPPQEILLRLPNEFSPN